MLPIKTTVDDAVTVVNYLKTKPVGATLAEAKGVLDSRVLDGRKLTAYQTWGLVEVDGERYKLTERGRQLSRNASDPAQVFLQVVNGIPAYRAAIEWAYHQHFTEITVDELAANWHEHQHASLGTDNEASIKAAVTCFFNVANGAGLGRYVVGRGGAATRLEMAADVVKSVVEAGPSDPPWEDPAQEPVELPGAPSEPEPDLVVEEPVQPTGPAIPAAVSRASADGEAVRVFISHGKNMDVVEQVETILDVADIAWEVAVEEETAAIPVPDKVFGAMRNCNAGIICVSGEAVAGVDGQYTLNQNVLIEIGAAFVLYDRRVVLLWDKRVPVPSNLQGLYRCEFEGNELSWSAGMKLMKAIQGFKR
ncbi:TIR domain-containing protein [Amnibacterium kyonggiense]|uniref:Putative nucleotide-binding protein with TIR-like domain n=1 Tax=Amnibacterium kyonggiense TaxID=595671 RepID=A0A4R7FKC1_9MICO|nr:TIR domain-containing protein [Amnibacterium kyonggiense]TDS76811.1 putative nucleotide-binding protein with TIR-like domain [Amnibacterium kyonggiense]